MPVVLMDIMDAFYANNLMVSKLCTVSMSPGQCVMVGRSLSFSPFFPHFSCPSSMRGWTDAASISLVSAAGWSVAGWSVAGWSVADSAAVSGAVWAAVWAGFV